MILRIEKPESCMDCVFGEERGYCCSLLDGEECYELHSEYDRPAWCPFDNGGKTITADGVSVVQEGANCDMDSKDNGVFYHLNCRICGRTFWSEDGFADVCDECKDNKNQFNNYVEDSKVLAKCVICGEYIEVEKADCVWIKVCDECKKAIKWAKTQMQERIAK